MQKTKAKLEKKFDGELGLIIDEMGRAMWNANRQYIAQPAGCQHENGIRFTPSMQRAWALYVDFCMRHPE